MKESELTGLYKHPKIKALINISHGEGFGLPIFEAAYSGLPVIAPGWSGQMDFLCDSKGKEQFYNVAFDIQPIQKEVIWPGVLVEDSMWAHPRQSAAKKKMRECYENIVENTGLVATSCEYANILATRFEVSKQYAQFVSHVLPLEEMESIAQEIDDLLDDLV